MKCFPVQVLPCVNKIFQIILRGCPFLNSSHNPSNHSSETKHAKVRSGYSENGNWNYIVSFFGSTWTDAPVYNECEQ